VCKFEPIENCLCIILLSTAPKWSLLNLLIKTNNVKFSLHLFYSLTFLLNFIMNMQQNKTSTVQQMQCIDYIYNHVCMHISLSFHTPDRRQMWSSVAILSVCMNSACLSVAIGFWYLNSMSIFLVIQYHVMNTTYMQLKKITAHSYTSDNVG